MDQFAPLRDRRLLILLVTIFFTGAGFGLVVPTFPYLARELGAGSFEFGILAASFAAAQVLTSPLLGRLSDRRGRRLILVIALLGMTGAYLIMGTATTILALLIGRVIAGALAGAALPTSQAFAADISTEKTRASIMGWVGGAMATGNLFGPLVGGILAPIDISLPFYAGAGLAVVLSLFAWRFLDNPDPSEEVPLAAAAPPPGAAAQTGTLPLTGRATRQTTRGPTGRGRTVGRRGLSSLKSPLAPYFGAVFTMMIGTTSIFIMPFYITDKFGAGPAEVGIAFALSGATAALVQSTLLGAAVDRLGEDRVILFAYLVGITGFTVMAFAPNVFVAFAAVMLMAATESLVQPASMSAASKKTHMGQGITMGLQSTFRSLGKVIGPVWAGFVYAFRPEAPWIAAAVIYIGVSLILRLVFQAQHAKQPTLTSSGAERSL